VPRHARGPRLFSAARSVFAIPAGGAPQPNGKTSPNEMSSASYYSPPSGTPSVQAAACSRAASNCPSLHRHLSARGRPDTSPCKPVEPRRTLCTCLRTTASPPWRALRTPPRMLLESHCSNVAKLHLLTPRFRTATHAGTSRCERLRWDIHDLARTQSARLLTHHLPKGCPRKSCSIAANTH
jgi:hypothetical protein